MNKFLAAQKGTYKRALEEIKLGYKQTCWMWYIFPQIEGIGYSEMSQKYAIKNREEAIKYLAHPVLGKRLREISRALLKLKTNDPAWVMGQPDDKKLQSSMTLFYLVSKESVFEEVIHKYFGGKLDSYTVDRLAENRERKEITMTEAIRGYSLAQRQYDLDSGPDREYKLDPEQAVECICCRQDWNQEDCKEYKEGFVCCDCEYEYITQLVEKNARRLAPEYIASDQEVEKDFYLRWWFDSLDEDQKVLVLNTALTSGRLHKGPNGEDWRLRNLMQEFAEEDDGFREFVERKEEA